MNWIKRNWRQCVIRLSSWAMASLLGFSFGHLLLTAHAQKPECDATAFDGMAQMTGPNSSIQYKCSPEGKWVVDEEATAKANAHDQKPEPVTSPTISFSGAGTAETGAYQASAHAIYLVKGGTKIAEFDAKGNLSITDSAFWQMIESHCVAVLTEKHTVHHKRTISGGEIPDDRMEWDEEIPEQTLRLKCSEEKAK
jgi:hypothetical protein